MFDKYKKNTQKDIKVKKTFYSDSKFIIQQAILSSF